jgi:DNA-binding MarR family transcriptional regulator
MVIEDGFALSSLDTIIDEIDDLFRSLIRITECSDRGLLSDLQLTSAQANTLQALERAGQVTMNRLAEEMLLHGTTMTRMVDALVTRSLVQRLTDPKDRRVVLVALTASGAQMAEQVRVRKRHAMRETIMAVPEGERDASLDGLRRMVALAHEWGDGLCADHRARPTGG